MKDEKIYFEELKTEFSERIDDFTQNHITKESLLREIIATAQALYRLGEEKE